MDRDVRRGWKCESLNLGVSVNMRAWSMGVYAKRSFWEKRGMKERVSMRQAWARVSADHECWGRFMTAAERTYKLRLIYHRRKNKLWTANTLVERPSM